MQSDQSVLAMVTDQINEANGAFDEFTDLCVGRPRLVPNRGTAESLDAALERIAATHPTVVYHDRPEDMEASS